MILSAIHVIDLHRIFMVTKCVHGHSWHVAGKLSELKVCCERKADIRIIRIARWRYRSLRRIFIQWKHVNATLKAAEGSKRRALN
mgnify:CR=1 FL=1